LAIIVAFLLGMVELANVKRGGRGRVLHR
jgi:hypothetical protein